MIDLSFLELQNKFRGLISDLKSKKFVKVRTVPVSREFRTGLRRLFLEARSGLTPDRDTEFLSWIGQQTSAQAGELSHIPIEYDELSGVIDAVAVPLERELQWITARILNNVELINTSRALAQEIEELVSKQNLREAVHRLGIMNAGLGVTLWAVQLRVALEQMLNGLEGQKKYVAQVRNVYKRGLLGFVAYHTGVRNEEKTTFPKFIEDIVARIQRHQYFTPPIQQYLGYRLASIWPNSPERLADVLRVEQSHSLFDVYETFVAVLQQIVHAPDLLNLRQCVHAVLLTLSPIDDFRLCKLRVHLGIVASSALPPRDTSISDPLLAEEIVPALRALRRNAQHVRSVDIWRQFYCGFALAATRQRAVSAFKKWDDVPRLLATILRRGASADEALASLTKASVNLRALPTMAGLSDLLGQIRRGRPDDRWEPWLIGLNSPTLGVEDFSEIANPADCIDQNALSRVTARTWLHLTSEVPPCHRMQSSAALILVAIRLLRNTEYQAARELLSDLSAYPNNEVLAAILAQARLHATSAVGDRQAAIELIAFEETRTDAARPFLPIVPAIDTFAWADYKSVTNPLAPSIVLNLLWAQEQRDAIGSQLRYAAGSFLRGSKAEKPSKLFDYSGEYDLRQLIYFLRFVCVPNVLDVSRILKSSRQVLDERIAICAALRDLDPSNSPTYEAEVLQITDQQILDEGRQIVDRTRIHVDIAALERWAFGELSEDFARYGDLLSLQIGPEQGFDDVLKELMVAPGPRQTFVPETEADAVLFSILRRVGEEFLTNSSFGLDFYLSKRIRHQSFIGLIRGPLEFANLITTKETGGSGYRRNDALLSRFRFLSPEALGDLDRAISEFAAKFDALLLEAKDSRLHIRSPEKPAGVIYLDLSSQLMTLTRSIVAEDTNFDAFFLTAMAVMWAALEPSLAQARLFLSEDLKTQITDAFDKFRAAVRMIAEDDPAFLEIDTEIGLRSTDVQRALDEAATWFTHSNIEASKRYFTLTQAVDIAIESALKCQRAFEPIIEKTVEETEDIRISASNLIFVHDALFVALDNARAHSGLKKPKVRIVVTPDFAAGRLAIDTTCETRSGSTPARLRQLEEIRALIDAGAVGRRTRREGGSGFLKLAAVVRQSEKGELTFGFGQGRDFRLTVVYALVIQQEAKH
ncbi:hypothetical protein [Bradyrhizobium sp. Gha]|uniref:hypothetical protein n=1 Tax=Bradyrhizobium sp. Gha TaxID=1855318 RepID=UPI0008F144D7|nr:hypothetical protein [Bradyrhizobium sp. Gha]SFI61776.1 hypothetical protein SAMN05216525_11163 [Bradyrhizobium sp. Gha]